MTLLGNPRLQFLRRPSVAGGSTFGTSMGAKARADILGILAGNTRHLVEFVQGDRVNGLVSPFFPVVPVAPISPHAGRPGHDHSGGMYGTPIQRVMWSAIYGDDDATLGGTISSGESPTGSVTSAAPSVYVINSEIRCAWIPHCAIDGAYRSLTLTVRLRNVNAACEIEVYLDNYGSRGGTISQTLGVGVTTLTLTAARVPMLPGSLQRMRLSVIATRIAPNDTRVAILSAALHQRISTP